MKTVRIAIGNKKSVRYHGPASQLSLTPGTSVNVNRETGQWQGQANWLTIRETASVTTSWGWGTSSGTSQPVNSTPHPSRRFPNLGRRWWVEAKENGEERKGRAIKQIQVPTSVSPATQCWPGAQTLPHPRLRSREDREGGGWARSGGRSLAARESRRSLAASLASRPPLFF